MATDKELLIAFRDQFSTGRMFTEDQVLVLMGYARGEEKHAEPYPDTEADGLVFCGKCGNLKGI